MRRCRAISTLLILYLAGCGDDGTSTDAGPAATGGTTTSPSTFPAAEPDTGARATGGVFEEPATRPASPSAPR
jgi:hypothetical protein